MNGRARNLRMHEHMFVGACVCVCACMHAHITSIKCFLKLIRIHYFIASLSRKTQDLSKQNKMSNITIY